MEAAWPGDQMFKGWQGAFWQPSLGVKGELEDSESPKEGWQQELQELLWTPRGITLPRIRNQINDRLKVLALASQGQPRLFEGLNTLGAVDVLARLDGSCFCSFSKATHRL